jgi:hypothetical protein
MTSNALQNLQPERSAGAQSDDHGADLADPETGGAAPEPQRVLVGQAPPRRRWPALRQVGRRGPLRGDLPSAVDEEPAAHLDQRILSELTEKIPRAREGDNPRAFSFGSVIIVHLCT